MDQNAMMTYARHPTSSALHFFDAANSHNVASGVHAGVYINGRFAWEHDEIMRMSAIFKISVFADSFWAQRARCLDIEQGAAGPEDAVPFCQRRGAFLAAHGMHVNDSVVYVNRSNRDDIRERLHHAGFQLVLASTHQKTVREWVATLDGTDITDAWSCQRETNGRVDISVLHGVNDFRKPR